MLTGKYSRTDLDPSASSGAFTRKDHAVGNGFLTSRGLDIAAVVQEIAGALGTTPSRVAIAWTLLSPAVTAPLIGARTLEQLDDNLAALSVALDASDQDRLEKVSAVELGFPHETLRRLGLGH